MDKGKAIYYGGVVCCVLFVFSVCWFVLGGCGRDVHDHGGGIDDARTALDSVASEQRNIESNLSDAGRRIDASIESADRVAERISEVAERITDSEERRSECAAIVSDSERRIAESLAICRSVRERAPRP